MEEDDVQSRRVMIACDGDEPRHSVQGGNPYPSTNSEWGVARSVSEAIWKHANETKRDAADLEPLQGRELMCFVFCAWGGTLIGNMLCAYPSVFSFTIQRHLDISSSMVGLFLSVPSLLAFSTFLVSPAIIDMYGLARVIRVASLVIVIAMACVAIGYNARSVSLMLPAFCLVKPMLGLVNMCNLSLLGTCTDRESFASLAGVGTAVVTLGYTVAHYTLPHLTVGNVLPTLLMLTVLMAFMNLYAASVAGSRASPEEDERPTRPRALSDSSEVVKAELERKLSPSALWAFPWKYWLVAFTGAFKASFNAFVDFQPYAFQRCNGLSEKLSNQIVGSVSLCVILVAPFAGCMFSQFKDSHGPLFIFAALLLLGARTVAALEFNVALAWCEMISTGMGQAFLSAGCVGLLPEVLAGREDLLTSGNSFVAFAGQLLGTITTQVCFAIFHGHEEIGNLDVTPGQFFMVAQGFAVLMLAIAIHKFAPLAPPGFEDAKDSEQACSQRTARIGDRSADSAPDDWVVPCEPRTGSRMARQLGCEINESIPVDTFLLPWSARAAPTRQARAATL